MNTNIQVFLIGTNHAYQYGEGRTFGKTCCSLKIAECFRKYLTRMIKKYNITLLAEEMNRDQLKENAKENETCFRESLPQGVAMELSIRHQYCDPRTEFKRELGIFPDDVIRVDGKNKPPEEVNKAIEAEWRKRELVWLAYLWCLDVWPALFICGAWHIQTFSDLLCRVGISYEILDRDWGSA